MSDRRVAAGRPGAPFSDVRSLALRHRGDSATHSATGLASESWEFFHTGAADSAVCTAWLNTEQNPTDEALNDGAQWDGFRLERLTFGPLLDWQRHGYGVTRPTRSQAAGTLLMAFVLRAWSDTQGCG